MSTLLKDQLGLTRTQFLRQAPPEVQEKIQRSIAELKESGIATGLEVGKKAKDFKLPNPLGKEITLYDELAKGPVILTFYRGTWCPFCNLQLKAYQQVLPEIHALGAQLIAISPQTPDNTLTMQEKHDLTFHVLSDTRGIVAAKYNVLYQVPDYLKEVYQAIGVNLSEYNGDSSWTLPVSATFMIDEFGVVRYAHVDPDFTNRMEPDDIIDALKTI